jgi:Arc/MetJ-type ribon-helix-helix transcriptional regulator
MNVRLTPHSEQLLKEQLAQGNFSSPEEVLERALETLAQREPAGIRSKRLSAAEAVSDILELRRGVTLGGLKIKDLIDEGRRI